MDIKEYQKKALATVMYGACKKIIYPTLGIAGESGEVAEKVKKVLRDEAGHFSIKQKILIMQEIGDVLWYCNALAHDLGYDLEKAMELNIEKLESRKARNKIHGNGDNR